MKIDLDSHLSQDTKGNLAHQTGFDVLLRLATGHTVAATDAMAVLIRAATDCPGDCARSERAARVRARNIGLQKAAAELGADRPGAWPLALRLEGAVERFRSRVWPQLRAGLHRGELGPVDAALHMAFLTGQQVPRTQRRLYDLVRR